jgi:hypothetical protein
MPLDCDCLIDLRANRWMQQQPAGGISKWITVSDLRTKIGIYLIYVTAPKRLRSVCVEMQSNEGLGLS